jgi:cyclomaltodextrinase
VMNYLFTSASLNFFAHSNLNMDIINQAGGLKDRVYPMNANAFANEVERILHLYPQDITYAQLNLLDSHDMPRFLTCASGDKNSLKLAWLFLLSMPGAPCIYYGDEIGVDGGHDPECRKAFPWDESKWDKDLLAYAKACIALRNKYKSLRQGTYRRVHTEDHVMVYARETKNESILVAFNASASEKTITLDLPYTPKILFGAATVAGTKITLPPRSGAVLK